jgi:3-methyladenine DNA glycosylase AlkD
MTLAKNLISDLKKLANKKQAKNLQRFFKTGIGEYGEGDIFWGLKVPQIRQIAKNYYNLNFFDVEKLIKNPVHEIRLCALVILVHKAKTDEKMAYKIYLRNTKCINNWDLVDLTAPQIVGAYLDGKDQRVLEKLAKSKSLWEKRIAMLATFHFIYNGDAKLTLKIAEILVYDDHDLIQKAVGWMLREVGKRCSQRAEEEFLKKYAKNMPRTMLRYAIERFSQEKREYYLKQDKH